MLQQKYFSIKRWESILARRIELYGERAGLGLILVAWVLVRGEIAFLKLLVSSKRSVGKEGD